MNLFQEEEGVAYVPPDLNRLANEAFESIDADPNTDWVRSILLRE